MYSLWPGRPKPRLGRRPSAEPLEDRSLPSISIQFNYDLDTNGFFKLPQNQVRRDTLETAALLVTSQLQDSLTAITPGGQNTWTAIFPDPASGKTVAKKDLSVPANTLIVFVGARSLNALEGDAAGVGGPGGFNATGVQSFVDTVTARGQPGALDKDDSKKTDFGPWGGSITFDTKTNWYFGQPPAGLGPTQLDFLSVAEHEIAHILGFGTAPSWQNRVQNVNIAGIQTGVFTGPASQVVHGAGAAVAVPVDLPKSALEGAPEPGHWQDATTFNGLPCTMDPILNPGTRAAFGLLDFAGLSDMGWQIPSLDNIVVPNQPPVVGADNLGSAAANTPLIIPIKNLLANDAPGPAGESNQTLSLVAITNAFGGTATRAGDNILFVPAADYSGPAGFSYIVTDNGRTAGQNDPKSAMGDVNFTIDPPPPVTTPPPVSTTPTGTKTSDQAKPPPVLQAPRSATIFSNTFLLFVGKNRVHVTDSAIADGKIRVTLTAIRGKLQVQKAAGVLVAGNKTAKITLTGSLAAVNRALQSLKFVPMKNFAGAAKVMFSTNDLLLKGAHTINAVTLIMVRKRK